MICPGRSPWVKRAAAGAFRVVFSLWLGSLILVRPSAQAGPSIALAWNANTETNLAGYRLYYGTAPRSYSASVTVPESETTTTVTNLQPDTLYYFAVTAFANDGLESDYSTEISYLVPGPGSTNVPPTALPGSVSTQEEQPIAITLRGTDANGDPLTYVIVTPPADGLISGASPNLLYRPNANFYGTDSLSFRVNDGRANSGLATISITVTPVNDVPTLSQPINLSLPVNAGAQSVTVQGISSGATNEAQALTVSASSSNPSLIPHPTVTYVSPNATGSLAFTPATDQSGVAVISVTVNDGQAANNLVTRTFTITVGAPGNQPPTINPILDVTYNEDAPQQLINFSGLSAGAPSETQTLSVTATSSNPGLIPHPTVRYDSPASGGYITFTPVPGGFGTADLTVTVNDGQSTNNLTARTFQVTINPVNDPPTLGRIDDVELYEDDGGRSVSLSGISSGATNELQNLVITATSSNPDIIPDPVIRYDSPATNGSLYITSVSNGVGSATITVTLNDGGSTRNSVVQSFYVAVRGVNDIPILSPVADVTIDANGSSGPIPFSIYDPDTAINSVSVRATSLTSALIPDSGLAISGSGTNRTLNITPALNVSGVAQVVLAATDGYGTNSQTIRVTVGYANQAPVISSFSNQTINVSSTLANLPFQISDEETDPSALVVTATAANPVLIPQGGLVLGGTSGNRTLSVTPAAGKTGSSMVTVSVTDGNRRAQRSFLVTVVPVQGWLTVATSGSGSVTPNLHGQRITVGENVTLTAVPASGQIFVAWTGSFSSTNRVLSFVMTSNVTLQAAFQADPYLSVQGTYNGLIVESNVVQHETSGFFSIVATSRGSYSAKVQVGSGKYSMRGLLGRNGRATNQIVRPGKAPLTVEVALTRGTNAAVVSGRVSDGSWTSQIAGDRLEFHAKTNPAPFAGAFTLTLPADPDSAAGPPGTGYGTVKVDTKGTALFLGMLADGSKSVQKVSLARNGQWPFYLPLYRNAGAALGWLQLDSVDRNLAGLVSWIKPTWPAKFYTAGFTNESSAVGTAYVPPTPTELKTGAARLLEVACLGANLAENVEQGLLVLPTGRPVGAPGPVQFGFSPATGLFKGTVKDPATGAVRTFSGVLYQPSGAGAGVVLGVNETGLVEVTPTPTP